MKQGSFVDGLIPLVKVGMCWFEESWSFEEDTGMFCRRKLTLLLSCTLLAAVAFGEGTQDDEKKKAAEKKRRDQLVAIYREHAASYEIELGPDGTEFSIRVVRMRLAEPKVRRL